jgi:hypothetical protein
MTRWKMNNTDTRKCIIAVEDWQMQCCGTPFRVGDSVDWIVHKCGKPSEVTDRMVEYYYEHHSSEWQELFRAEGIVDEIKALFCRLELRPSEYGNHSLVNYRVYETAIEVESADGWDEDVDGLEFGEYEVTLRDCVVRPAQKAEVTFS